MTKVKSLKTILAAGTLVAAYSVAGAAQAGLLSYELNINSPVFNSANGDNNVPDLTLENTSDVMTGAQISDFSLTIGNTAFNFDFVRGENAFTDTADTLTFTRISGDLNNDNSGVDLLDYDFAGFDIGDVFQFEVDIDPDSGAAVQDYREVLFPEALLTVTFSTGDILSQTLNPANTDLNGYTFTQALEVPEPATIALFGAFALAGAGMRRRAQR